MTKLEKVLLLTTAVFFALALWLLPASESAKEVECAFTLPGPTARTPAEGAMIVTLRTDIDLNHASAEELRSLPGVGPVLAEAIVAYREENGPFASVAELLNVKGFGEATLRALYEAMGEEAP